MLDSATALRVDRRRAAALILGVALLAFAARIVFTLRSGGLLATGNYDDGVYYGAATALVHGRLPYRDFLFLQPPAIAVVLAPFALLGRVLGDAAGLGIARVAWMLLGAGNAALVALLLRRFGSAAAILGGTAVALFPIAIWADHLTLIEPFAEACLLGALALLELRRGRVPAALAGVLLGVAIAAKIWFVVPAVVLLVVHRRRAGAVLAGAAGGAAVLLLPFLIADPAGMVRQVVLDQLGRPRVSGSAAYRLVILLGAPAGIVPGLGGAWSRLLVAGLATAIVAVLAVAAWRRREARVFVALLVTCTLVLLAAPSFYYHYALFALPGLALVVGAGAGVLIARVGPHRRVVAATALAALVVISGVSWYQSAFRHSTAVRMPAGLAGAIARVHGCTVADDPITLILTSRLSQALDAGCAFWPDPTAWTYDADRASNRGSDLARADNAAWQAHILGYLTSGAAVLQTRERTGLSEASRAELERGAVLYRHGAFVVREVVAPAD